jgi:hypothetical protein
MWNRYNITKDAIVYKLLKSLHFYMGLFCPINDESNPELQRSSSGLDPGFPHSHLRGGRNNECILQIKSQDVRRHFPSKKTEAQGQSRRQVNLYRIRKKNNFNIYVNINAF